MISLPLAHDSVNVRPYSRRSPANGRPYLGYSERRRCLLHAACAVDDSIRCGGMCASYPWCDPSFLFFVAVSSLLFLICICRLSLREIDGSVSGGVATCRDEASQLALPVNFWRPRERSAPRFLRRVRSSRDTDASLGMVQTWRCFFIDASD